MGYNFAKYYDFVILCSRICKCHGSNIKEKMEVEKSLISIALGGISFVLEVINALEYITGARLALIDFDPGVALGLIIMSLSRLVLLYIKWLFWIKRWQKVVRKRP